MWEQGSDLGLKEESQSKSFHAFMVHCPYRLCSKTWDVNGSANFIFCLLKQFDRLREQTNKKRKNSHRRLFNRRRSQVWFAMSVDFLTHNINCAHIFAHTAIVHRALLVEPCIAWPFQYNYYLCVRVFSFVLLHSRQTAEKWL